MFTIPESVNQNASRRTRVWSANRATPLQAPITFQAAARAIATDDINQMQSTHNFQISTSTFTQVAKTKHFNQQKCPNPNFCFPPVWLYDNIKSL
jgi:hypothetical protein